MLDDLDMKLIAELTADAQQTSIVLSRKLEVSDTTIRRRISRLSEEGIIANTIVPNAGKLGFTIIAMITLQVELGCIDEVEAQLVKCPNVHYVADCTGTWDIIIGGWFLSSRDLQDFIKKNLSKLAGIKRSETFIVLDVKKNEIGWLQSIP